MNRNHAPQLLGPNLSLPWFTYNLWQHWQVNIPWQSFMGTQLQWQIGMGFYYMSNNFSSQRRLELCTLKLWYGVFWLSGLCFCFLFVVGRLPKKAAAINFLQVPNSWIEMAVQLYKIITPKSGWPIIFHHPPNPWNDLANNQGIVGCTPCIPLPRYPYEKSLYKPYLSVRGTPNCPLDSRRPTNPFRFESDLRFPIQSPEYDSIGVFPFLGCSWIPRELP